MGVRATRIELVINEQLLPNDKIIKLMNDFLLWAMITVAEYDTLNGLLA